jgi:hypothetical protein
MITISNDRKIPNSLYGNVRKDERVAQTVVMTLTKHQNYEKLKKKRKLRL